MVLDITNLPSLLTLVVAILFIALWLWILYDVIVVSKVSVSEKLFWIIILVAFNIIGIIFYVLLARKESDCELSHPCAWDFCFIRSPTRSPPQA